MNFRAVRGHTFLEEPLLDTSPVILDLGANRGEFSTEMSGRYGGRYYLLEANPELAVGLPTDGPFVSLACAVAESDGRVNLNVARNDVGSSILTLPDESIYDCTVSKTMEVPAMRLATVFDHFSLDRVDLLKMDIEGAEVQVLSSADPRVLGRIGQISAEFHSDAVFGFGLAREVEAVIRRLRSLGFVVLDFSEGKRIDVLAVQRKVLRLSRMASTWLEFHHDPRHWLHRMRRLAPTGLRHAMGRRLEGWFRES